MDKPRAFVLTMMIPLVLGLATSLIIGWEFWHGVAFGSGLAALVYSVSIWMGAEPWIRLETPLLGLPIAVFFGVIIWWGHFGLNQTRPVTLMMQAAVFAPFAALVLFALCKMD